MLEITNKKQKTHLPRETYSALCAIENTKEYASKLMRQLPKYFRTVSTCWIIQMIYNTSRLPGSVIWWLS